MAEHHEHRRRASELHALDDERLSEQFAGRGDHPIGTAPHGQQLEVHGEVREVRIVPSGPSPCFEAQVSDGTGELTIAFPGHARPDGVRPGAELRLLGTIEDIDGTPTMREPVVESSAPAHEAH